jgi:anti-sigma B factor antagonist
VDLKPGRYDKDGIEAVGVEGEIDVHTAPRLRELLTDLAGKNKYQLVVNMDKVGFLGSTGLGVLAGGLKRVRAHDGSLDLACGRCTPWPATAGWRRWRSARTAASRSPAAPTGRCGYGTWRTA